MKLPLKYLLLIIMFALGCKDEIILDSKNYKKILVVNGFITNEKGPYTIRLSVTSPVDKRLYIPFSGCVISIFDNMGFSEVLTELEPGVYSTSESGIQGVIGNEYRIFIVTPEGVEYKTEFQKMNEPVEIDSVYAKLLKKESFDYPFGLSGYQFYVDSKIAPKSDNYLLWNMIETYQYTADYQLYGIWDGKRERYVFLGELPEFENVYRCWNTKNVNYIITGKTTNLSIPKISKQPLHFVSTETKKLQERYSLLLKQYSIGKEAYYYWRSIEEMISEENPLFATQPYNVKGNVVNVNNSDELVFGYFTVGSVSQNRIFVNRPYVTFYYETCSFSYSNNRPPPVYFVLTDTSVVMVSRHCIDCRSEGGETSKPDFWIDY